MVNIRNYIFIATLILESSLFILFDLSPIYIFFFFLTVFEAIIFSKKGARLSVAGWWLYVYLTCSFLVVACFKFTSSNIKYIDNQLVTVIKIQMICKCKYKTI